MHDFFIIAPDGGMLFEAAGVVDILQEANRCNAEAADRVAYTVSVATTQRHQVVHGRSGLNLLADCRLADLDPTDQRDTILLTGRGASEEERAAVADWLRIAAPHARRVASVCAGALLLARAGLLDGRRATTHWRMFDSLETDYPQVQVERGPIFVHDGPVWTSAGVSGGFDLTLALVEEDLGFSVAREVAQELVMFLRRPGGQSQFSRYLHTSAGHPGPIRDLQIWIQAHLADDLGVEVLAGQAAMSPRNFTRVFTRETGTSPARYVEEMRLAEARRQLEQGARSLERIARSTGFGNSLNLRRTFARRLQITPSEYRDRFHRLDLS